MKKITALFLFFAMILCSSGLYISYNLNLYGIHQQQREMILHSDNFKDRIVTFSFPLNFGKNKNIDFHFVEDDEIMFEGKMYDIVNQYKTTDSIFIKCIPDKIEDDIRSEAANHVSDTGGATTQKNFSFIKFNPEPFTNAGGLAKFRFILYRSSALFLFSNDCKPATCFLNIPSPPPWNRV